MYKTFLEKGPSAIDIEIRSLGKYFDRVLETCLLYEFYNQIY